MRAIDEGLIGRFGALDPTDGGDTLSLQRLGRVAADARQRRHQGRRRTASATTSTCSRTSRSSSTIRCTAISSSRPTIGSSAARRSVIAGWRGGAGARCRTRSACRCATTTSRPSASITRRRGSCSTPCGRTRSCRRAAAVYAQNEIEWTPWLRTLAACASTATASASTPAIRRTAAPHDAGLVSPKGGVVVGPWQRHRVLRERRLRLSQQRRARRDDHARSGNGEPAERVTPLVRAKGAEVGVRTVAIPHLQTSVAAVDARRSASELVFVGDAGTTEAGRPSHRYGRRVRELLQPAAVADA